MFIRDVIRNREPYSMRASASVLEAAEFMAQRRIGAVCVLDDEGKLVGVFSERDILNRVIVPRQDPGGITLGRRHVSDVAHADWHHLRAAPLLGDASAFLDLRERCRKRLALVVVHIFPRNGFRGLCH